jgi:hypothetical protein
MNYQIEVITNINDIANHPDVRWQARNISVNMKPWTVTLKINGEPKTFTVPKGFQADGSSAASISSIIGIMADGRNRPAWLLHDYLYDHSNGLTRKQADYIFYYMLKALNMGDFRAKLAYAAARLAGWIYWN